MILRLFFIAAAVAALTICYDLHAAESSHHEPGGSSNDMEKNGDAVNNDLKQLEGTWHTVALQVGAENRNIQEFAASYLDISGTEYVIRSGKRRTVGTFTIDPSKNPKWIDVTLPHEVSWTGIYELGDDRLRVCFDITGAKRPAELKAKDETSLVLQTYNRVEP